MQNNTCHKNRREREREGFVQLWIFLRKNPEGSVTAEYTCEFCSVVTSKYSWWAEFVICNCLVVVDVNRGAAVQNVEASSADVIGIVCAVIISAVMGVVIILDLTSIKHSQPIKHSQGRDGRGHHIGPHVNQTLSTATHQQCLSSQLRQTTTMTQL